MMFLILKILTFDNFKLTSDICIILTFKILRFWHLTCDICKTLTLELSRFLTIIKFWQSKYKDLWLINYDVWHFNLAFRRKWEILTACYFYNFFLFFVLAQLDISCFQAIFSFTGIPSANGFLMSKGAEKSGDLWCRVLFRRLGANDAAHILLAAATRSRAFRHSLDSFLDHFHRACCLSLNAGVKYILKKIF